MSKACIKAVVSGKVQGVFFRDTVVQKAKSLQLTGQVKNTLDGKVELIACGESDALNQLTEWLWQGSPASNVTNVDSQEIPWESFDDFMVTR